jgi:hypothetical protein
VKLGSSKRFGLTYCLRLKWDPASLAASGRHEGLVPLQWPSRRGYVLRRMASSASLGHLWRRGICVEQHANDMASLWLVHASARESKFMIGGRWYGIAVKDMPAMSSQSPPFAASKQWPWPVFRPAAHLSTLRIDLSGNSCNTSHLHPRFHPLPSREGPSTVSVRGQAGCA